LRLSVCFDGIWAGTNWEALSEISAALLACVASALDQLEDIRALDNWRTVIFRFALGGTRHDDAMVVVVL